MSATAAASPMRRALVVGALGVVYGDIGTSPIYTLRECLKSAGAGNATEVVLGLPFLVFWSLMIVVTAKYVLFVMRDVEHWAVMTIGTGLCNARFTNRASGKE